MEIRLWPICGTSFQGLLGTVAAPKLWGLCACGNFHLKKLRSLSCLIKWQTPQQPGVHVWDGESNGLRKYSAAFECWMAYIWVRRGHRWGLLALSALDKSFSLGDNFSCCASPHPVQGVEIRKQRIYRVILIGLASYQCHMASSPYYINLVSFPVCFSFFLWFCCELTSSYYLSTFAANK